MRRKIIVGSRDSKLAVMQTELVMEAIRRANPQIDLELITLKTTGDMILDKTLDKIGGKGLFVKELDQALADGRIDLAVHSLKDMPMETTGMCWCCQRERNRVPIIWRRSAPPARDGSCSCRSYIRSSTWKVCGEIL